MLSVFLLPCRTPSRHQVWFFTKKSHRYSNNICSANIEKRNYLFSSNNHIVVLRFYKLEAKHYRFRREKLKILPGLFSKIPQNRYDQIQTLIVDILCFMHLFRQSALCYVLIVHNRLRVFSGHFSKHLTVLPNC